MADREGEGDGAVSDDVMVQPWCCLTCSARFTFGQIKANPYLQCPQCKSGNIHPADGTTHDLPEYPQRTRHFTLTLSQERG